ncbi:MAG: hypothetical protein HKN49_04965 [Gammaproteobacteria bacterium]|nr:hypothetical protein [Gammaproteobacteria bacterium]
MQAELRVLLATFLLLSPAVAEQEPPSFDFLDYLGTLVEEDGTWIHPDDLDDNDDDEIGTDDAGDNPDTDEEEQ